MSTNSVTQTELEAQYFKTLRAFMGYVENGSSCSVKMFQDDATRKYHLHIGQKSFYGASLNDCINKAVDAGCNINY